jgi:hypothetical protein
MSCPITGEAIKYQLLVAKFLVWIIVPVILSFAIKEPPESIFTVPSSMLVVSQDV